MTDDYLADLERKVRAQLERAKVGPQPKRAARQIATGIALEKLRNGRRKHVLTLHRGMKAHVDGALSAYERDSPDDVVAELCGALKAQGQIVEALVGVGEDLVRQRDEALPEGAREAGTFVFAPDDVLGRRAVSIAKSGRARLVVVTAAYKSAKVDGEQVTWTAKDGWSCSCDVALRCVHVVATDFLTATNSAPPVKGQVTAESLVAAGAVQIQLHDREAGLAQVRGGDGKTYQISRSGYAATCSCGVGMNAECEHGRAVGLVARLRAAS